MIYPSRGHAKFFLVLIVLAVCASSCETASKKEPLPVLSGDNIVLQNKTCRYEIGLDGKNRTFIDLSDGKNYCKVGEPFMVVGKEKKTWNSSKVALDKDVLTVSFGDSGVEVKARCKTKPHYFVLTVESVTGQQVDWVKFCNLALEITENVGTLINAAWDGKFGACVLALNDQTHSAGSGGGSWAFLTARCYKEFGLEGAKVAIVGVPTVAPDPSSKMLDAIEEVELGEGLPHPTINGVWIKRAPERFASYLMVHNLGEHNVDEIIEMAKGGFGCIEFYPWRSTPSYRLNPKLFPNGLAGLKKVCEKIHAAGLQVGLHVMQSMVGWGAKDDPYISPKADPRLLQDRYATLAAPLGEKETVIHVTESLAEWPEQGDLYIEGEIVRYAKRSENSFTECTRGMHKTTITAHPVGTKVGHLVNCFNMWGNCVYAPDLKTDMVDEICDNIARVFNAVGADMSYFDGGEELCVQPPHWRNVGRVALGVMKRVKKPFVLEGNAIYTHLAWHVISRGSPHYDPIYFGRREYTLRFKGQNPAHWKKNLLTGDVGWFCAHSHSQSTYAVTPDEVMLLCLKALGGKSPISFSMATGNKRMGEILHIIRVCDELKRVEYFSEKVCAELSKPMAEHTLEQRPDGVWVVRPMQFGPPHIVYSGSEVRCNNPYAAQTPWLRLRGQTRLTAYGANENIVLADFSDKVPFATDGTASPELIQSVEPSKEKTPDGASAFCYRATNKGKAKSGWYRLKMEFPKTINLCQHRRLGLWVRSEGKGGILNVQLLQGYGARDHYIPLDFKGWAYRILDPPEDKRFYDYRWPYPFIDLMYWRFKYDTIKGINIFYNDLPPGETACLIGRIEALREFDDPVKNPTLEVAGQKMAFPVSLKPDEYVELDWDGKCRHFEPNGGLVAELKPEGRLQLAQGENAVRFASEGGAGTSPRVELTLALRGDALPNEGKGGALKIRKVHEDEGLNLLPDGKGGFKLVQGLYELVGRESVQDISVFDGKANVWTVENNANAPCKGAIAIARGADVYDVDYDDPKALVLENFDDLAAYEMSATNQFEKYVIGGEKRLAPCGPVRAGVTQTFIASKEDARAGAACAVYTAVNSAGPDGWCAKGKRFPKPLDLSRYEAIAFWLYGDGKKETLRFQFRDTAGANADWLPVIDFTGWRLMVFHTADAKGIDWKNIEYLIFYFNNIPANTTVTLKLDDVKAIPKLRKAPPLRNLALIANGKRIELPVALCAGQSLATDGLGGCSVYEGVKLIKKVKAPDSIFVLKPGMNQVMLTCETAKRTTCHVTARVIRLGLVE